ncbi:MAG: helix-turn-helix domain-containing protein [Thermoplasmata archaeon]
MRELANDDRVAQLLEEMLRWVRFQGILKAKEVLLDALKTDEDKIMYQYSDGRSSTEIAKLVRPTPRTVRNYWARWNALGIVEPMSAPGGTRYRRVFSLDDFGIEVPKTEASPESHAEGEGEAGQPELEEGGQPA